jgi:heme exporter protein A
MLEAPTSNTRGGGAVQRARRVEPARLPWPGRTAPARRACCACCAASAAEHGEIRWRGAAIRALREEYWSALAYVGHLNGVKDDLTAAENLRASTGIAGLGVAEATVRGALEAVGLAGFEDSLARFLSQGQRRRIALARLFLSAAVPLWILDEPFTALDARGVASLGALLARHLAAGNIVVFTTHQEVPIDAARTATVDLGRDRHAGAC